MKLIDLNRLHRNKKMKVVLELWMLPNAFVLYHLTGHAKDFNILFSFTYFTEKSNRKLLIIIGKRWCEEDNSIIGGKCKWVCGTTMSQCYVLCVAYLYVCVRSSFFLQVNPIMNKCVFSVKKLCNLYYYFCFFWYDSCHGLTFIQYCSELRWIEKLLMIVDENFSRTQT